MARLRNLAAHAKPDIADLAAAYAFGLARHHGFNDGNKRTAWVIARLFLSNNSYRLNANPIDAVKTMEALASGAIEEKELGQWFRNRLLKV
ncbi:MAG: type II toxin-antitoxin system death-on-curing family toxin [Alphaproteobacteria bacterium]|nr:MAG: type II toxin-antitoxin system death-on-curing family toxin [Alphaproteobacteria bacterium]